MTKTERYLSQSSDVRELVDKLELDENDILSAAKEQPALFLKAARYKAQKQDRRADAEFQLDVLKTDLALKIRARDRATNKRKPITEANIKELLLKYPAYQEALKKFARAQKEEDFAKRLLDAYDHRGKSIKMVIDMVGFEVVMEKRMSEYQEVAKLKKNLRKKYPGIDDEEEP